VISRAHSRRYTRWQSVRGEREGVRKSELNVKNVSCIRVCRGQEEKNMGAQWLHIMYYLTMAMQCFSFQKYSFRRKRDT